MARLMSSLQRWQERIHIIIEGTDTPLGKAFDLLLLVAIVLSVAVVMLDSVVAIQLKYGAWFDILEGLFTLIFSLEYALRLFSARNRLQYVMSFYGIVDLLSLLPSILGLFMGGMQYLLVVRVLRVLRIFRILKLMNYLQQAGFLLSALQASRHKILVFFMVVILVVTIFGSVVYVVEGAENGFTSIPVSIYWAIVTMTTVGYGDISPKTPLGQFIASLIMITGYSIIAVPTGVFTAEIAKSLQPQISPIACSNCGKFGHNVGANYCDKCGENLHL